MTDRAKYVGVDTDCPKHGDEGIAYPADGYNDPSSCEYEAYLFMPDNDPEGLAYYCDPRRDLVFIDENSDENR